MSGRLELVRPDRNQSFLARCGTRRAAGGGGCVSVSQLALVHGVHGELEPVEENEGRGSLALSPARRTENPDRHDAVTDPELGPVFVADEGATQGEDHEIVRRARDQRRSRLRWPRRSGPLPTSTTRIGTGTSSITGRRLGGQRVQAGVLPSRHLEVYGVFGYLQRMRESTD